VVCSRGPVLKVVFNRVLVESSEGEGGGSRKTHDFGDNQCNGLGESDI